MATHHEHRSGDKRTPPIELRSGATGETHAIGESARHGILDAAPKLRSAIVHVVPCGHGGRDHHEVTQHHFEP